MGPKGINAQLLVPVTLSAKVACSKPNVVGVHSILVLIVEWEHVCMALLKALKTPPIVILSSILLIYGLISKNSRLYLRFKPRGISFSVHLKMSV